VSGWSGSVEGSYPILKIEKALLVGSGLDPLHLGLPCRRNQPPTISDPRLMVDSLGRQFSAMMLRFTIFSARMLAYHN